MLTRVICNAYVAPYQERKFKMDFAIIIAGADLLLVCIQRIMFGARLASSELPPLVVSKENVRPTMPEKTPSVLKELVQRWWDMDCANH
jgi:hypothetical protein